MNNIEIFNPKARNPVNIYAGSQMKCARMLAGLSQKKLGDSVRLTQQQIMKYERGDSAISSFRLYEFCIILDVDPNYFFEGIPEILRTHRGRSAVGFRNKYTANCLPNSRGILELVKWYTRIEDPDLKQAVYAMVKAAGKSSNCGLQKDSNK